MIPLILCLCTLSAPRPFVLPIGDRLHAIGAPHCRLIHLPSSGSWEGDLSGVEIEETPRGAEVRAKIDIRGPGWMYVVIRSEAGGVIVRIWQSPDRPEAWETDEWYPDAPSLLASDSAAASMARLILYRINAGAR